MLLKTVYMSVQCLYMGLDIHGHKLTCDGSKLAGLGP